MHFCSECENMYYIRISDTDENKLIYYCRRCGHENDNITNTDITVSRTIVQNHKKTYTHLVNEYTKLDPTLPRVYNIKCPNDDCVSNQEDKNVNSEVIYLRYDESNLKYIYLCSHCDTLWETKDIN